MLNFLYDASDLKFRFLPTSVPCIIPIRKGMELAVVYHLHNLEDNVRIRFKIFTGYQSTGCIYGNRFILCGELDGTGDL